MVINTICYLNIKYAADLGIYGEWQKQSRHCEEFATGGRRSNPMRLLRCARNDRLLKVMLFKTFTVVVGHALSFELSQWHKLC
jgi:hypothetical protein